MKHNKRSKNGKFVSKNTVTEKDIYDMMKELGKKSQHDMPIVIMGAEDIKRFDKAMKEEYNRLTK